MVEYDNKWLESYIKERQNSYYIINDATKIDYIKELKKNPEKMKEIVFLLDWGC